ncbi:hypothetical protein L3X38_002073 [Prunus dulcis]|uniref:Uncharacterized protein n=1 Tax=Prunus dulcis TaxID=3755 RepID=A0AAD4WW19_PRUDU|nr:hypothetical protein L3X38_002073 [Prunus dulcis]
MLKARYFPNSDFMHATLSSIPSFVWSSILWGRDLLDANLYWCVGDGKMIDVYKDKWIPIIFTSSLTAGSKVPLSFTDGNQNDVRLLNMKIILLVRGPEIFCTNTWRRLWEPYKKLY